MEIQAIKFNEIYTSYSIYYNSIITSINDNNYLSLIGLNLIDDFKTKYEKSLNYVSTIIYNYYLSYYLTATTKESFERLSVMTLLGKLPKWQTLLTYYFEVISKDAETTNGLSNTTTRSGTFNKDGTSAQATTPQDFQTSNDYINDYTSSQQKFNNKVSEESSATYKSNNIGSLADTFSHIEEIPSRISQEVISTFARYFYSGSLDLTPNAIISIDNAINKKQDILVSATNIKLINGESILGSGNLEVGSSIDAYTKTESDAKYETITSADENFNTIGIEINKTNANVETNTKDISTNKTNITNLTSIVNDNVTAINNNTTAINTNKTNINKKQNSLSTTQLNACNSGITSSLVSQITTNKNNIVTNTSNINTNKTNIANLETDIGNVYNECVKLKYLESGGNNVVDYADDLGDSIEFELTNFTDGNITYIDIPKAKVYNHFIYMVIQSKAYSFEKMEIRFNFVTKSSSAITTYAQLKQYLGSTFTIPCNGIGNYNQTNGICYALGTNNLYMYGFDGEQTGDYTITYTSSTYTYTITDNVVEASL